MDASVIKGVEGLELNGSDAAIRKSSSIRRIAVEGYDSSSRKDVVEEGLRKHFASRGIKLIHAFAHELDFNRTILCRCGLIYVNEEDEEKALTFDGSDMGGRILRVTAYPFDSNRLDHFFATPEAQDKYRQRVLNVTGFDTSLARDVLEEMVRSVFPGSYCSVLGEVVFVYLRGKDAVEKALKLSGRSAGGFNLVVNTVLPLRRNGGVGVSRARILAMSERTEAIRLAKIKRTKAARLAKAERAKAARLAMAEKDKAILSEGNQKSIMTTD